MSQKQNKGIDLVILLAGFTLKVAGELRVAKGAIPMVADDLFVHLRNDKTLRYCMHRKAQDAVVACFG